MTLDHIARRKINQAAQITHARRTPTRFFHRGRGGRTSAEIRAHISEISRFLALSARWLRESLQRETVMAAEWAASGGW